MKRNKWILYIVCIVLVMFFFSRTVAEAQSSNYFVMKAGAYKPNSSDLKDFNAGFNGEAAFGHYFSKNFAMELGLGYFTSTGPNSASGNSYYAIPLTLAAKAIYPIDQWEIYAIGGAGAYYCDGKLSTNSGSPSNSTTAFGGFLGAGADYTFFNNWFLGIEGKYLWVKPDFTFFGLKDDVALDGWTVTANVGFRF
jgi:outer membrane protein W